jgi:hypothetical protein
MIKQSEIAVELDMRSGCPARQPSPKKSPAFKIRDDCLLSLLGNNRELNPAFLDKIDGISRIALGKNAVVDAVLSVRFPTGGLGQKDL